MAAIPATIDREDLAARLATTAYDVALRHGIKGSFAQLELNLWREMRLLCQDTAEREERHS